MILQSDFGSFLIHDCSILIATDHLFILVKRENNVSDSFVLRITEFLLNVHLQAV